jgi:outer membrane lipoprotein carrier protein
MKKVLLTVVASGIFGMAGFSQNNTVGQSDPDAKKILDAVSKKIKSYKAVEATFTLKIEDSKGAIQGSKKGTVYMKGNKYKVIITGQEIFCDGTTIWTYDKSSNEVTITKFDPSANSITPQKIFTNFYDKDFLYKLNGQQIIAGKTMQEIEMTPIDKTANFFKVYVYVDKSRQLVSSTKMLDKNGTKYSYSINTLNGNAPLADNVFVFDKSKYPGVEEVDLRQ